MWSYNLAQAMISRLQYIYGRGVCILTLCTLSLCCIYDSFSKRHMFRWSRVLLPKVNPYTSRFRLRSRYGAMLPHRCGIVSTPVWSAANETVTCGTNCNRLLHWALSFTRIHSAFQHLIFWVWNVAEVGLAVQITHAQFVSLCILTLMTWFIAGFLYYKYWTDLENS